MVAVAFSNVWIFVRDSFQCLDTSSNAVSLRSLIPTPAAFQVPFSPGSVHSRAGPYARNLARPAHRSLHPSKAVTSNTTPKGRRAIRPECPPSGGNVGAICLFVGESLPGATLQTARVRHRPDRASASGLGSFCYLAELRGTIRGVHYARNRHATAKTPRHAGCSALRSQIRINAVIFRSRSPTIGGGFGSKKFSSKYLARV